MKLFTMFSAAALLAIPLAAQAQSLKQQQADLAEALRVQQFICDGIAKVRSMGSTDFSAGDLARCRDQLEAQRVEYLQFMVAYVGARGQVASNR